MNYELLYQLEPIQIAALAVGAPLALAVPLYVTRRVLGFVLGLWFAPIKWALFGKRKKGSSPPFDPDKYRRLMDTRFLEMRGDVTQLGDHLKEAQRDHETAVRDRLDELHAGAESWQKETNASLAKWKSKIDEGVQALENDTDTSWAESIEDRLRDIENEKGFAQRDGTSMIDDGRGTYHIGGKLYSLDAAIKRLFGRVETLEGSQPAADSIVAELIKKIDGNVATESQLRQQLATRIAALEARPYPSQWPFVTLGRIAAGTGNPPAHGGGEGQCLEPMAMESAPAGEPKGVTVGGVYVDPNVDLGSSKAKFDVKAVDRFRTAVNHLSKTIDALASKGIAP